MFWSCYMSDCFVVFSLFVCLLVGLTDFIICVIEFSWWFDLDALCGYLWWVFGCCEWIDWFGRINVVVLGYCLVLLLWVLVVFVAVLRLLFCLLFSCIYLVLFGLVSVVDLLLFVNSVALWLLFCIMVYNLCFDGLCTFVCYFNVWLCRSLLIRLC